MCILRHPDVELGGRRGPSAVAAVAVADVARNVLRLELFDIVAFFQIVHQMVGAWQAPLLQEGESAGYSIRRMVKS